MNPSLITLIINLLLVAFVLFGFLGGLKGIKKSTFNLVTFLIELVVVFFLTPVIAKLLLNISISGKTINAHIYDAVSGMVGADASSSEFIKDILSNAPLMIANLVASIVLIIVLGLIFKLISLIVYKLMYKKDGEKVIEKCEIVNGSPQMVKQTVKKKKHRLAGGFVGAFHGFLLALTLFLPLCGAINVFSDISGINQVSADVATVDNGTGLKPVKDLLQENIPQDVMGYIKAVDGSFISQIGRIGNISETSLNLVANCTVNGVNVQLGNEIKTLVDTYDAFVDFALTTTSTLENGNIDTIFNDIIQNPDNYDFDKLHNTVDLLFKSNLINAMGKDALLFSVDMLVESAKDEQTHALMNHIKTAIVNYAESKHTLKEEIDAVIGIFEISAKSELIKTLSSGEKITVEKLESILLNEQDIVNNIPENQVLSEICTELSSSHLLQKLLLEMANYGIENLEKAMNDGLEFNNNQTISLAKIDSSKDYSVKSIELQRLVIGGMDLYEIIEGIDADAINEDVYNVFELNLENLAIVVGELLTNIVDMSVLKDTGVFGSICDAMANTEYNNYVDFVALKENDIISTQFNYLSQAIGELKSSGIINTIRYISPENQNDSINEIIDKLAVNVDGKNYVTRIISPILNCSIFKNALEYGLNEANKYIESQILVINPNAEIHDFNTSALMTENENAQLINVLNNLVQFMAEIDVAKLGEKDFVETIIYSDLNSVGRAFESIRTSNLFKDYDNHQGVYNDLMDSLEGTDFSKFFNFIVAKNDNFTWTDATEKLMGIRTDLDAVSVTTSDGDVSLLKYILTNSNYDDLLDSLKGKTVNLKGVFELELISPIAAKVVNLINGAIKEYVGEELGANIVDTHSTAKLTVQAQNLSDIINKALDIDFDNIDLNNIDDENLSKFEALLDELEINANIMVDGEHVGVFREAYNALLIKMANIINEEIKEFVGTELGVDIQELDASVDIVIQKEDILDVLKQAIKIDFESINLDNLTQENKELLNNLLETLELNAKNDLFEGVFTQSYNALLNKIVNLINDNIKNMVGAETAGVNIEILSVSRNALTDSEKIKSILNSVVDMSADFKEIDIKTLNVDKLFEFIAIFKNNTTILDGIFAQTYNAMLVYLVNTINQAIKDEVGVEYSSSIEFFTGETDMTVSYFLIAEVVSSANDAFGSIEEGQNIEDVETTKLERFRNALDSNKYTRGAYTALENYLVGKLI